MTRSIPMFLIGLVFGGLAGFLLTAAYGITLDGHDHTTDHGTAQTAQSEAMSHSHTKVITLDAETAPTVRAILHPDPAGGWTLEVQTTNFRFAPEHVSRDHITGEGHAHVYVNGTKIARLYGNWMQLPPVTTGDVVSVVLTANDHSTLATNGQDILARVTVP